MEKIALINKVKEYKQTWMLNYVKVRDRLQITIKYFFHYLLTNIITTKFQNYPQKYEKLDSY